MINWTIIGYSKGQSLSYRSFIVYNLFKIRKKTQNTQVENWAEVINRQYKHTKIKLFVLIM